MLSPSEFERILEERLLCLDNMICKETGAWADVLVMFGVYTIFFAHNTWRGVSIVRVNGMFSPLEIRLVKYGTNAVMKRRHVDTDIPEFDFELTSQRQPDISCSIFFSRDNEILSIDDDIFNRMRFTEGVKSKGLS